MSHLTDHKSFTKSCTLVSFVVMVGGRKLCIWENFHTSNKGPTLIIHILMLDYALDQTDICSLISETRYNHITEERAQVKYS